MKRATSINNIPTIQIGEHVWKLLHENDGSEVYEIILGSKPASEDWLHVMYGKGTLSIRQFAHNPEGKNFRVFMELPLEMIPPIINALIKGHNLTLFPLHHKDTFIEKKPEEPKCTGNYLDCHFVPSGGKWSPINRRTCQTCGVTLD